MNRKQIPPPLKDVQQYVKEQGYLIDADEFFDYHESRGWRVGKLAMKCWQSAVRTWVRQQERFANEGYKNSRNTGKKSNHARVSETLQAQIAAGR